MRPSILGFFTVGMTTLSMLSVSCVLYSAGSGVKRVLVVLSGLRWSWFCCHRHRDDQSDNNNNNNNNGYF